MLKRNLIANYLGQGWVALIGFVFVPLYIRYLGVEAYGIIGVFAMLQAWLALLDAGLNVPLGREMANFTGGRGSPQDVRDLLRSIELVAAGTAAIFAAVLHFSADWLATHWVQARELPASEVALAFSCMGLVTALRMVEGVYRSCILGLQMQVEFNVANSVMATLRAIGALAVLAYWSPTLQAFFAWQGIVSTVTLVVLWWITDSALPPGSRRAAFSGNHLRRIRSFALGSTGVIFLGLMLTQTDKLLLSRLLPLAEYGAYTLAAMVTGALYTVVTPVAQAWFPRLSQLHAQGERTRLANTYHEGAQLVTVMLGSAATVMIVFAEPILRLWTGNPELTKVAAPLLTLLATGTLLNGLMWIPYQAQFAHGWTGLAMRINLVAVVLIVPALFWVTPRFGAVGAAAVWVFLNAGYVVFTAQFMHRRILRGEKLKWYAQDLLFPLAASGGATLLVAMAAPDSPSTFEQLATIALAALASLTASALACPKLCRHALRLLPQAPRYPHP